MSQKSIPATTFRLLSPKLHRPGLLVVYQLNHHVNGKGHNFQKAYFIDHLPYSEVLPKVVAAWRVKSLKSF